MKKNEKISRRDFLAATGVAVGATALVNPLTSLFAQKSSRKKRLAIVGTGHRATGMFGRK